MLAGRRERILHKLAQMVGAPKPPTNPAGAPQLVPPPMGANPLTATSMTPKSDQPTAISAGGTAAPMQTPFNTPRPLNTPAVQMTKATY